MASAVASSSGANGVPQDAATARMHGSADDRVRPPRSAINVIDTHVFEEILSFLDTPELKIVGFVCRYWWHLFQPTLALGPFGQLASSWSSDAVVTAAVRHSAVELEQNALLLHALRVHEVDLIDKLLSKRSIIYPLIAKTTKKKHAGEVSERYCNVAPVLQIVSLGLHLPMVVKSQRVASTSDARIHGVAPGEKAEFWSYMLPAKAQYFVELYAAPEKIRLSDFGKSLASGFGATVPQVTRERVLSSEALFSQICTSALRCLDLMRDRGWLPCGVPLIAYAVAGLRQYHAHWSSVEAFVSALRARFGADPNLGRLTSSATALHEACGFIDVDDACPELIRILLNAGAKWDVPLRFTRGDGCLFGEGTTPLDVLRARVVDISAELQRLRAEPHDMEGVIEKRERCSERLLALQELMCVASASPPGAPIPSSAPMLPSCGEADAPP